MKEIVKEKPGNGNGRSLTFDDVYQRYNTVVKNFAKKMFDKWNHEEFESLVWERLNDLIEQGRFEHVNSERAFIFGLLRHVAWEQLNRMRAQYDMISLSVLSDETECPPARANDPHDIVARRELLQHIVKYVNALERPLPEIFQHYFLEGQNSAWISRKLHMNPNTVRVYIYMLRRQIDSRFGDRY